MRSNSVAHIAKHVVVNVREMIDNYRDRYPGTVLDHYRRDSPPAAVVFKAGRAGHGVRT